MSILREYRKLVSGGKVFYLCPKKRFLLKKCLGRSSRALFQITLSGTAQFFQKLVFDLNHYWFVDKERPFVKARDLSEPFLILDFQ